MTDIKCACCGNAMSAEGAMVLSPPQSGGMVHVYRICATCWIAVGKMVSEKK